MNQWTKRIGLLVGLGTLVVVIVVLGNISTQQIERTPTRQEIVDGMATIESPLPTPTSSEVAMAPDCQLKTGIASPPVKEQKMPNHEFEPPQILMSGKVVYNLAGWLPDNHTLLLTQENVGSLVEQIVTLDVDSKEFKLYGERRQQPNGPPIWLEAQQAVAYTERIGDGNYQLLVGKSSNNIERIISDLTTPNVGNIAKGQQILFLGGKHGELPIIYDKTRKTFDTWRFSVSTEIRADRQNEDMVNVQPYQIATEQNTNRVALYSNNGLYLADLAQQTMCYLDLGKIAESPIWSTFSRWSPNGRQLAMLTTSGAYQSLFPYVDLTLLDVQSGEMRSILPETGLTFGNNMGRHYFTSFSWSPDSKSIIATAIVSNNEQGANAGLFMVTDEGSMLRLFPDFEFGTGISGIEWSPNGQSIVFGCPTVSEDRLCFIKVKKQLN